MVARRVKGSVVVVALAMALGACGGGTKPDTGDASRSSTTVPRPAAAATATTAVPAGGLLVNGVADAKVLAARLAAFAARSPDAQAEEVAALDLEMETAMASASGLEAALGGAEATKAALAGEGAAAVARAETMRGTKVQLLAFHPQADVPEGPSLAGPMFAGYMVVALGAKGIVSGTNDGSTGTKDLGDFGKVTVTKTTASLDTAIVHTDASGVTTSLKAGAVVTPCPDANGEFTASSTVDISSTVDNGNTGQRGTLDVKITGHVNDDATLTGKDLDFRMQWADFVANKGQFIDLSGSLPATGAPTMQGNRAGGALTAKHVQSAAILGALFAVLIGEFLGQAAQDGWESGRCVTLEPTASAGPKGLKPSQSVSLTAAPRAKADGQAAGGTVTAKLAAGGQSVTPSDSKVPADATFTYVAPPEKDKSGTVAFEARSKRGVAKASIDLDTKQGAAYQIAGGAGDFQTDTLVCDIMAPFTLTAGGFTVNFSGGLTGTYTYTGPFAASGGEQYAITLPDGLGKPGTMDGGGVGSAGGASAYGTEHYTLTPAECP